MGSGSKKERTWKTSKSALQQCKVQLLYRYLPRHSNFKTTALGRQKVARSRTPLWRHRIRTLRMAVSSSCSTSTGARSRIHHASLPYGTKRHETGPPVEKAKENRQDASLPQVPPRAYSMQNDAPKPVCRPSARSHRQTRAQAVSSEHTPP